MGFSFEINITNCFQIDVSYVNFYENGSIQEKFVCHISLLWLKGWRW
jgi:hypothetical protein